MPNGAIALAMLLFGELPAIPSVQSSTLKSLTLHLGVAIWAIEQVQREKSSNKAVLNSLI